MFNFIPKIVFIGGDTTNSTDGMFPYFWNMKAFAFMRGTTLVLNMVTISENSMNWYVTGTNKTARHQLNESGITYGYVIFA